jgi:hypothetical protein
VEVMAVDQISPSPFRVNLISSRASLANSNSSYYSHNSNDTNKSNKSNVGQNHKDIMQLDDRHILKDLTINCKPRSQASNALGVKILY